MFKSIQFTPNSKGVSALAGGLVAAVVAITTIAGIGPLGSIASGGDDGASAAAPIPAAEPAADCLTAEDHFYALDTPDAKFGPAVDHALELQAILVERHVRRVADAALTEAHWLYANRSLGFGYGTQAERDAATAALAADRTAHCAAVAALEEREATAKSVEIKHITTDNLSAWMTDPADPNGLPSIIFGQSDVTSFWALVFTYEDGSKDVYKLDCGFQPMSPDFPETPPPPPPTVPPATTIPPVTTVPNQPTTTVAATTTIPGDTTTTGPTTTVAQTTTTTVVTTTTIPVTSTTVTSSTTSTTTPTTTTIPVTTTTNPCASGKCTPPVTVAPPPTTVRPPVTTTTAPRATTTTAPRPATTWQAPVTTLNDSGVGSNTSVPTPTTSAPAPAPGTTISSNTVPPPP